MWLDMALLSDSDTSSDCHFVLHSRIPPLSNRTLHLQQLLRYLSISFRSSPTANLNSTSQSGCWTKPAVDRIVITILDALRFDFVAPSSLFPEKKPWMDKLQVLQKLTSEEGSFSTIFKAIADPPTATLQHLKVKRYIDTYSASSVIGFPSEDLVHVDNIYAEAQDSWSQMIKNLSLPENEVHGRSCDTSLVTNVQEQIHAYSGFLASVAELARSKWTEFDLMMMGLGLGILLLSLFIHLLIMRRVNKLLQISRPSVGSSRVSVRFVSALCGGTTRMQFPCK